VFTTAPRRHQGRGRAVPVCAPRCEGGGGTGGGPLFVGAARLLQNVGPAVGHAGPLLGGTVLLQHLRERWSHGPNVYKAGLALKSPPKKTQKNHLKKPTKDGFFGFFLIFQFFIKIIQTFLFQTDIL
jgi:hypothetical protein